MLLTIASENMNKLRLAYGILDIFKESKTTWLRDVEK